MQHRLRLLLPALIPLLLSFALLQVFLQGNRWDEALEFERLEDRWQRSARFGIDLTRANHTIESQIDRMGFRFVRLIERAIAAGNGPEAGWNPRSLPRAFAASFPASHRPPGTLLFAIGKNPGESPILLEGAGLASEKKRVMTEVLGMFDRILAGEALGGDEAGSLDSRCVGIFGRDFLPRLIIPNRRGMLTPGWFFGRPVYLFWNSVRSQGRSVGTFLAVFPGNIERQAKPLSRCLGQVAEALKLRQVPLLVALHPTLANRKLVSVGHRPRFRGLDSALRSCWSLPFSRRVRSQGKLLRTPDLWMMRGLLSENLPYEVTIVSPAPNWIGKQFSEQRSRWQHVFWIAWAGLLIGLAAVGRAPRVPLSLAFPGLFFLTSAIPLSAWHLAGLTQLEKEKQNLVQERRQELLRQLEATDLAAGRLSRYLKSGADRLLAKKEWRQQICHLDNTNATGTQILGSAADAEIRAIRQTFAFFRQTGRPLDAFFLFRPNCPARGFLGPVIKPAAGQVLLDRVAPIVQLLVREYEPDRTSLEFFPLTTSQRQSLFYARSIDSFAAQGDLIDDGLSDVLLMPDGSRYSSYCRLIYGSGSIQAAAVFLSHVGPREQELLQRQIHHANRQDPGNRFVLGVRVPGGQEPLTPAANGSYWHSRFGRPMRQLLDLVAHSRTDRVLLRETRMLVASSLRHCPGFLLGVDASLSDILVRFDRGRWNLARMTLLITLLVIFLGSLSAAYLAAPLATIEAGLRALSSGRFPDLLPLPRNDELGDMNIAFSTMVDGLKERQKLGRFVSGALDETVRRGEELMVRRSDTAAKVQGVVLVSDIRDFTTLSETHPPDAVVEMLNQHFEALSAHIQACGGRIDRFVGDAVVAVFTAERLEESANQAIEAALGMMRSHAELQGIRRTRGEFTTAIGIGIAAGEVYSGSIGAVGRLEYTLFGSTRSSAEHLEGLSKRGHWTRIVVCPEVRTLIGKQVPCEALTDGAFEIISDGRP